MVHAIQRCLASSDVMWLYVVRLIRGTDEMLHHTNTYLSNG
jgi:hypothetical protein